MVCWHCAFPYQTIPSWWMPDHNVLYYAIRYMTPTRYQFQHALSIKPGEIYIQADVYYTMWHIFISIKWSMVFISGGCAIYLLYKRLYLFLYMFCRILCPDRSPLLPYSSLKMKGWVYKSERSNSFLGCTQEQNVIFPSCTWFRFVKTVEDLTESATWCPQFWWNVLNLELKPE